MELKVVPENSIKSGGKFHNNHFRSVCVYDITCYFLFEIELFFNSTLWRTDFMKEYKTAAVSLFPSVSNPF